MRRARRSTPGIRRSAELANHSKIFGSETAVRVITDLMRVVGVDSYDDENDPLRDRQANGMKPEKCPE